MSHEDVETYEKKKDVRTIEKLIRKNLLALSKEYKQPAKTQYKNFVFDEEPIVFPVRKFIVKPLIH